jgi:4-alpha-glucanotransferase
MNDDDLRAIAAARGIELTWQDVGGQWHEVALDTLRAIIAALGADDTALTKPNLITADAGCDITFTGRPGLYRLQYENGAIEDRIAEQWPHNLVRLPPINVPGYHRLINDDRSITIAVAPPRCWTIEDALAASTGPQRAWGLAAQIYALHRPGDGGIGDFAALAHLAHHAGQAGAAALALSPVHAAFSAEPGKFSPYSPSSRVLLNGLYGVTNQAAPTPAEAASLIDWPASTLHRLAQLRRQYETLQQDHQACSAFAAYRRARGEALQRHAIFEAIHAAYGAIGWRDWPAALHDPAGPAVAAFAADHEADIGFHAFLQFHAETGLQAAHEAARNAGMAIGLITDLAVGTDHGGSDSWGRPGEMLAGLSIGAPPDFFNPRGQDWGLTNFSPQGMVSQGFTGFIDMLRAALRHAGGVRMDHVMGLARLWVTPVGAGAAHGAYLRYPQTDLLRLVRLESQRHRAIILGEDLGTLPHGFRAALDDAGIAGLRILWFEREGDAGPFISPHHWTKNAVAMSSTHDLPTIAGWWRGNDLALRALTGHPATEHDEQLRAHDRDLLWQAFRESGAAPAHTQAPAAAESDSATDAAIRHITKAQCDLLLLPLEDVLGLAEQPNLPGTIDEHPNWRRRLTAPAEDLLAAPAPAARLACLAQSRS